MAQKIQLPDGTFFPMKEGETPEQALMVAASFYPEAFKPREEKPKQDTTGLKAAAASGFERLGGEFELLKGKLGVKSEAEAQKEYEAAKKRAQARFTPTEKGWTEDPFLKFRETLGGSLPYMALPATAGIAALAAPVSAPVAAGLGLLGAGAVSAGQFTGSNLAAQLETGKTLEQASGTAALAAAIPQALVDTAAMALLPGVGKLFSSVGSKLTTAEAKAIAEQTFRKAAADYTAKTGLAMGREGFTETVQQVLERLQAGTSLTDEDARKEYIDSFIGGAVLAGAVSPAGRYIERSGARKQAEEADAQDKTAAKAAAAQAKAAADAAEEARKQTPEYMRQAVAESAALEKQKRDLQAQIIRAPKGETLTEEQKQANVVINAQLKELAPKLTEAAKESNRVKPLLAKAAEEARLAGMSPEEFMLEQTFRSPGMQVPKGGRFETVPEEEAPTPPPEPTAVERYAVQQTEAAQEAGALTLSDITEYLLRDPVMAAEIVRTRMPIPGLPEQTSDAVIDALALQLKAQARQEMTVRDAQLRSQLPAKPAVGKRKAPDYDAYLDALDKLDFDRREGVTESDIRELESLRRQTAITDQGELFGTPTGQRTVLGNAPKTRQEYVADLRIARAAGDRKAAEAAIANLRKLDDEAESQKKFQTGAAPEFRLTGEQRQRLFESGYTEEQIDEAERRAQKSAGQVLGAGQTPMSVAIQQLASDNRAEAFAKIVDLVSRYNRGAAKQEDLNAARDRLVSGLITDIQQSRGTPLTDSERQDVTRDANMLLRELIERFGDTRTLSQKGPDTFVPAQTATGEFRTEPAPYMGFATVESQAPGRRTFGNPLAAAQSIREGLEELRSRAITGDTTSFSRQYTPNRVSAEAVQTQLERELAKDPKSHSAEQRRTLEAIGDNLRMMLRPESREDVSAWLYDLARDADNVSPELTQSVNDTLAAVEKAKRSETELETREFVSGTGTRVNTAQQPDLPLGPGRELQRTELAGPQRAAPVTEGAYSQISTAPSQEETQSTVFSNFAQLEKFLASDALQQVRSAIGLGRPTLARLNARLEPFVAKIKDIQAKAKALSIQAQQLERRKRGELESLKVMSAKDMAAEERSLTQAKRVLEESKRQLAELEAPLQKELAPLIKEFEEAQKQFEAAVAAQEETFAVMLRSRDVFEARELAAIEKVHRIQARIKRARRKILGAFEKDFGKDPRNLSRMMREFKETGKQAEFNEQLKQAYQELAKVFFNTRSDDAAIKQFLSNSVKFELQIQAQAGMIDAMALKLLDAGLALQVVKDTQLDLSANKAEILTVQGQAQEASRTLQALEAKQQERLDVVKQLEDSLGLSRQEINHRISEDVSVAEVLRASNDAEKDLVSRLDALMGLLNENVPAVKAYRAFKRSRDAAIRRQRETPAQKKSRDTQQEKLIAAIGRDPASFEGERISFEKRNKLMEELKASDEARTELEALIAATDEAIPLMQTRIAEAEKELKRLNAEIAALEALGKKKPRGFQAQLEQKSALAGLPYLIAARDKFAKVPQQMAEDIAAYERDKVTAQSNLATLEEREAELAALFSNDPEVQKARTEAIDARIAKVETNLRNNIEGLKEKKISKTTRESREREVRKYKKELQRLQAQRSAKFGIARRGLPTLAPVTQAAEAGERLDPRKVGPLVAPTRTAGNIRTGDITTTGERKLSPRAPITQSGKAKDLPAIAPVAEADTVEDRILGELDAFENVRLTVLDRLFDARLVNDREEETRLKEVLSRVDSQIDKKQAELKAAQKQAAAPAEETASTENVKRLLLGKEEKLNVDSLKSLYRTSKSTGTALKLDTIRGLVDRVVNGFANAPQIEVIESESQLPDYIQAQAKSDNVEGSIPGLFDPNTNKVYLVASNLFTAADVFTTIAHEVTGHFGLRSLLGSGYANEMGRIYNGNRDVKAKADAKMRETPSLDKNTATEEVLADMAEQDPNAKGPGVLRAVYNALRGLIRRVFGQTVSDKDVQQLVANARRHVIKGGVNRVTETGTAAPLYRVAKPKYESENALTELADRIIAQPKSFKERMGSNLALEAEMNTADMRAAVQEVLKRGAKELGNDDLFTQAMYNVRKADQYMPLVYTALSNGPLEFYTDDKGLRGLRSSNQNNAQEIFNAVKDVPGKNTEAKFALASTYMIAQRAANKGLSKLDLGELGVTEAKLAAAMSAANADPALKSSLEEVRRRYNAYNEGQIKLLAESGKISKAEAKAWLKDGDYVPYYRVREDGTAELVFGGEKTLTIGDIRTQPYLAELKGGETKILPLNESIIRNTMLITKAALYNNATKEIAYAMQEFGKGKGEIDTKTGKPKDLMPIQRGHGPAGSDIIRFKQEPDPKDPKDDGQRWQRIKTKGTAMEGIPAELVVKSLEGAHLTLPAFLKIGGIAGDWLRKGVTRMPPYIFRQLIRDPMAASFTGGLNYGPFRAVVMAGTEFLRSSAGRSEASKKLIEKGLIQSGVFTGDPDDMSTFATQLASGKDGPAIDRLFGMLDRAAMRADAATRALVYENARKNGLSEVEADMMTMESMNFYKRGLSPMVQYGNRLIPFMNAQIQGLNVLGKAMRGNMPFEDRQRIQRKFWNNAVMLFGVGLVYAMAMEDDDTFKNAKPRDKYTNFFLHLPGVSEAVKLPLPYEAGWFFSAAVALADAMKAETNGDQQLQALREMFLSSVPGYSSKFWPQAVKPLVEVYTNKNFFSGQNIESVSMQNRSPEERFNSSTTEAAKALAKVLPLSPVQIEHIARGYFGTAPLAMMSVASGFMREDTKGAAPERRLSEMPIVGTVFQKKYGGADADTMYAFAKEATQRAASLKDIQKNGTPQDYKEYLANHRTEIMLAPMARNFEMLLGRLRTQEDVVRNRKDLNEGEKRARLDQLDKVRQDLANKFNAAVRKVEAARAS